MAETREFIPDSVDLQTRLNTIIHTIPAFWEKKPHQHFTNHGPTFSQQIHNQKLAQLAQELPEKRRLNNDEIFIVSAAAWLYEIGMQSPLLARSIVDFDYQPGDSLTPVQLQEIRTKKHFLTEHLLSEIMGGNYQGPPLGLIPPEDGYVRCIRLVCRWCSNEPLDNVQPEILPVNGVPVRVKLLVALLRLADQLYIDGSRINLDLLERSNLPIEQYARWWVHNYVQILPIKNGQIPFYYFLPASQKEYLGHIRALIEPNFEHKNNPVIKYLMTEHQLYLIPDETPTVQFDAGSFVRPMSSDLVRYLRQAIKSPIETPMEVLGQSSDQVSVLESEKPCLLVLDYENLMLQLGLEGYFFTPEEISRLTITLLKEASNETTGHVRALAIGHWKRPDLREFAQILEDRVYELVNLEGQESSSVKIGQELGRRLQSSDAPAQIILVAPRDDLAKIIQKFANKRQLMNAWISGLPEAEIYQAQIVVEKYRFLKDILLIGKPQPFDHDLWKNHEAACILRVDDAITKNEGKLPFNDLVSYLNQVDYIETQASWWQLWLTNQGIIIPSDTNIQDSVQLNSDHPEVVKTRDRRTEVIKILGKLSPNGDGVEQKSLVNELLNHANYFQHQQEVLSFLELLKGEAVVFYRDAGPQLPEPIWYLNPSHWAVVVLNIDSYLAQFVVLFDHILVREGFRELHEHTLFRHLALHMEKSVAKPVYDLALTEEWVDCQNSREKFRNRDDYIVLIKLANNQAEVGQILRNRDIVLNILYHKSARDGLNESALWEKLKDISSFTLDEVELKKWLNIFIRDSILTVTSEGQDADQVIIKLNLETPLTQRLLGRMNAYGLVRNIRLMRATRPDKKGAILELRERLTKFVTNHDGTLADLTIAYAREIKLIKIEGESVYLNAHSFVRHLDQREQANCKALAAFVKTLVRPNSGGWVPRHVVIKKMENDIRFGYAREEHEYWLDQTIHRLRLMEQRKEQSKGPRPEFSVRVLR